MKKIKIAEIKEKSLEFAKDHKDAIIMFGVAFANGLICFKLGEINEALKPDYEKMMYKSFAHDCTKDLPVNTGDFKIHGFSNSTLGKFNGLDMAKDVLEDPETRDSIIGLAMFVKEKMT